MDKLAATACKQKKQIQVALDDGKVYVDYIIRQPLASQKDTSYIEILPTLSGYRGSETKEIVFTTDYVTASQNIQKESNVSDFDFSDFKKYVPMHRVTMASVFNPDIFNLFAEKPLYD